MYYVYVDGSAHPNPGPGGFGVVVLDENKNLLYTYNKQYEGPVTNNEMELKAILYAMVHFGQKDATVISDSAYAVNTFSSWMYSWASKGWIKSDKKTPENLEIIKAYYELELQGYKIKLEKTKGHSDDVWNNLADRLATGKEK